MFHNNGPNRNNNTITIIFCRSTRRSHCAYPDSTEVHIFYAEILVTNAICFEYKTIFLLYIHCAREYYHH